MIEHFEPGDGTHYRIVVEKVEGVEAKENNISDGYFFAFGLGNSPMVGYFFSNGKRASYDYVVQKFWDVSPNDKWTLYIVYRVLNLLLTGEVTPLHDYGISEEITDKAYDLGRLWLMSLNTHFEDAGFMLDTVDA